MILILQIVVGLIVFVSLVPKIDGIYTRIVRPTYFLLFAVSVVFYLLCMSRTDGIDHAAYDDYFSYYDQIPDIGYRIVAMLFQTIGFKYQELIFIQGLLTILAVKILCVKIDVPFTLSFAIYLIHSAVARDFSQSRVGLSVVLLYFAQSQSKNIIKLPLIVAACSIHVTVLFLVIVHMFSLTVVRTSEMRLAAILICVSIFGYYFGGELIQRFDFLDSRVEIYVNWKEDLYGNQVADYSQVFLLASLFLIFFIEYKIRGNLLYRQAAVYLFCGVVAFIGFSDYAIFAHRLSHLMLVSYPFLLAGIIDRRFKSVTEKGVPRRLWVNFYYLFVSIVIGVIGFRPGTAFVLQEMKWGF